MFGVWSWHSLRAIGNSTFAKATVFVPVVGYLILLNAELIELTRLEPRLGFLHEEYPWRLALIYYGLSSIALAEVIYALRCPDVIKRFDNASDYVRSEIEFVWAREERRRERIFEAQSPLSPDKSGWRELFPPDADPPISRHELNRRLASDWHGRDGYNPVSRLLCGTLFAFGFFALGIPTVDTFLRVTNSLLWGPH